MNGKLKHFTCTRWKLEWRWLLRVRLLLQRYVASISVSLIKPDVCQLKSRDRNRQTQETFRFFSLEPERDAAPASTNKQTNKRTNEHTRLAFSIRRNVLIWRRTHINSATTIRMHAINVKQKKKGNSNFIVHIYYLVSLARMF